MDITIFFPFLLKELFVVEKVMSRKRTHRCKQFTTEQFIETGAELSNATQSTHFPFKI